MYGRKGFLWVMSRMEHRCQKKMFSSGERSVVAGDGPVRVRFAPSPTGKIHLGGFRTALLNYLFAAKYKGKFLLRIEDTDQTRLVPEALEMIETDLNWLGIKPDESPSNPGQHGPYMQSQRLPLYQENLTRLIDSGSAYECFCSEKRMELIRREAVRLRQIPRYDNKCRDLTREEVKRKKASGEKYCVRFKLEPEHLAYTDLVYGQISFNLTEGNYEGDPVILKSDGYPTYHYANVVDDHYMEISHVLRGVEWQVSTPKHLQLYRAFKWKPPEYAHLPIVLNKDGTKLSKRQGDISISHYRNQTYYPIALANFVTKSGGGFTYHGVDKLCDMKELAESFTISEVNTGGCHLDFLLLEQLNQLELRDQITHHFRSVSNALVEEIKHLNLNPENYPVKYMEKIIKWCPERVSKLRDLVSHDFGYLWSQPSTSQLSNVSTNSETLESFVSWCEERLFDDNDELNDSRRITQCLEEFSSAHKLKHKTFLRDLRTMLIGITKGPPIVEIFHLFGKHMICSRFEESLEHLKRSTSLKEEIR